MFTNIISLYSNIYIHGYMFTIRSLCNKSLGFTWVIFLFNMLFFPKRKKGNLLKLAKEPNLEILDTNITISALKMLIRKSESYKENIRKEDEAKGVGEDGCWGQE